MRKLISTLLLAVFICCRVASQAPALHIHFVSHNEPNDHFENALNYATAKSSLLQMAGIISSQQVKWNLQTSDGLVLGALNDQSTSGTNIFKTLASAPYSNHIEIDPRSKNMGGRNVADQWYLLDSLGANPTHHLGGCIYYTTNPALQPIDWEQYRQPVTGNVFGNTWQCSIITGAGSFPPHQFDLNDFGLFKPDTAINFYQHNPSKNLWCMGVGCAPLLTDTTNEQDVIDLIQAQVDSLQSGLWPSGKFYVTRIMTNQRDYKPAFFQKLQRVIDSLKLIPSTQLKWTTISETFADFDTWQTTTGLGYSQWLCGQTVSSINQEQASLNFTFAPNPSDSHFRLTLSDNSPHNVEVFTLPGQRLLVKDVLNSTDIDMSSHPPGMYWLVVDNHFVKKLLVE